MPIYEYECAECGFEFSSLILNKIEEDCLTCKGCGGKSLKKLISRVCYHASEADRVEAFNPAAKQPDSFYRDTRNIGLGAKKRAQRMGVDLGSQFESKLEKLRTNPSSVTEE